jgi:gamma-glutamyltranspeptidase / glutathione hydrolase
LNRNVEQWQIVKNAVKSERGVVAAQNWRAAASGADILAKGGNAVDAAIACALSLSVVEPWMCGLGGSGYIVIWLAKEKRAVAIDFQGTLPSKISFDDYPLDSRVPSSIMGFPGILNNQNVTGYRSITIPGAIAGFSQALHKFGKLGFDTVINPTIELAERGLPVDWFANLQISLGSSELAKFQPSSSVYLPDGFPPQPEQFLKLGNLPKTLRKLADKGPDDFYNGELAEDLVSDLKAGGSRIDLEDLSIYNAIETEPLVGMHRGHHLFTPGPTSGGVRLNEALKFVEENLDYNEPFGAETYLVYAKALNKAFITHKKKLSGLTNHGCTSHMSSVDADGNMVALTYTLLNSFGSKVVLPKTGVIMNNSVSYFDPRPGYPTSIEGGKRINSSNMCPTVCVKDGEAKFSVGASGANHIVPCTMELAAFLLDYDLTLEEAFNLPRIDVNETDVVTVDPNVGNKTIHKLGEYFELNIAQNLVFPKLYSCPSGVYRDKNSGHTFGFGDKNNPVAGAVSEDFYNVSSEDSFDSTKTRA